MRAPGLQMGFMQILSAGPDGDFGFKDAKKRTDNIRSDARE